MEKNIVLIIKLKPIKPRILISTSSVEHSSFECQFI